MILGGYVTQISKLILRRLDEDDKINEHSELARILVMHSPFCAWDRHEVSRLSGVVNRHARLQAQRPETALDTALRGNVTS